MSRRDFLENEISKKHKRKSKIKKIIAVLALIVVLPYFSFKIMELLKNPSNTYVVVNGEIFQEDNVEGYIIRNETVIEGNNSGKEMSKIKQEGERVAKGDTVFRYESDQEDDLKNKIAEIDSEIQKVAEQSENLFSSDKKMLELQILSEMDNIYQANNIRKIQEHKNNVNTLLNKKARILGELNPSNSYLKDLINQRAEYEEQLSETSEDVRAPEAGMTSYRVDGLEEILTTDDFSKLNNEFLNTLDLNADQNISSSTEKGKIVNNYFYYIVFNINSEEAKKIEVNKNIKIIIQGEEEINAKIVNIIEEADGSRTIAVRFNTSNSKAIEYRKISFEIIWWKASGYRVPNSAIIEENNIKYVVRNRNGYLNKMAVKILKEGEEYSIISGYTKKELQELGLSEEEINSLKTITLYDRIQLDASIK